MFVEALLIYAQLKFIWQLFSGHERYIILRLIAIVDIVVTYSAVVYIYLYTYDGTIDDKIYVSKTVYE